MNEKIQDYFFIELNNQTDGLVKICPVGEVIGIDRRVFVIDGETVLKNSIDRGIDIALNKNHYDSEAYGWFPLSSLVLKDDGIYGKLELNNLGKVAVENKHFRYLSPELNVNQLDRTVQSIMAVGLVNSPNLLKKSLNKQEKEKDMPDDLKKEVNNLTAENLTLKKEVNNLETTNKSLQDEIKVLKEQNKTNKIDTAIVAGELLPAQKDFAMSLEANSLEGYLGSVKEANLQITKNLKNPLNVQIKNEDEKENNQTLKAMGWEA